MTSPFRHSASWKGPVPIISCVRRCSFPEAKASEMIEQLNIATSERNGAHGSFRVMTTVASSWTVTSLRAVRMKVQVPLGSFRSEEHTSELQSRQYLVCRLLLEKKKK